MMKQQFWRLYKVVRGFLFRIVNKEFLIFCFFLILSGGFWLSMALDETYEREFLVPVSIVKIPDNVLFSSEVDDTVSVMVSDKGFAIMSYMHAKRLQPLELDFSAYANRNKGKWQVSQAELQGLLSRMLLSSSRIKSVSPEKIEYSFSYGTSKNVPVSAEANVSFGKNRYLLETKVVPDTVKVFADKQTLRGMTVVPTEEFDVENLRDSFEITIPLRHSQGVKCIPDTVVVKLKADVLVERSVEVPIRVTGVPAGKLVKLLPEKVKIMFSVGGVHSSAVTPEQFRVVVNYNEIAANPAEPCRLHLQSMPSVVSNATLSETKVTCLFEQQ